MGTDGNWSLTATFAPTAPVTQQLTATQTTNGADSGTASFTIHLPSAPALTVTTTSSRSSFTAPGQGVLYRHVVTNTGNVTLTSVGVVDNTVTAADLTCPTAVLAPGADETCTGTHTTTFADVLARSVVSSAVAQATPPHTTTPVRSDPSTSVVPLAVSPVRHVAAVAHKTPVSPAKLQVTG